MKRPIRVAGALAAAVILATGLGVDRDWMEDAACKGRTRIMFHHEAAAKKLCESCDVSDVCLSYALTNREVLGVWGGKSEAERKLIKVPGRRVYRMTCERCAQGFWTEKAEQRFCGVQCANEARVA